MRVLLVLVLRVHGTTGALDHEVGDETRDVLLADLRHRAGAPAPLEDDGLVVVAALRSGHAAAFLLPALGVADALAVEVALPDGGVEELVEGVVLRDRACVAGYLGVGGQPEAAEQGSQVVWKGVVRTSSIKVCLRGLLSAMERPCTRMRESTT